LAHSNNDNAGSSSDSIMYDPGSISSNILSSSMQNSGDNIDGNSSPLLRLTPFPFDNDDADSHISKKKLVLFLLIPFLPPK